MYQANILKRCTLHPEIICFGNHHQLVLHGGVSPMNVGKEREAHVDLSIHVAEGEIFLTPQQGLCTQCLQ